MTHQDRLRRLLQRIRALKVVRLVYTRRQRLIRMGRWLGLAFGVALVAIVYVGGVVALSGEWTGAACGSVLLAALLWIATGYALYRLSVTILGRAAARARRDIGEQMSRLETTIDARCPSCGGHAQVLPAEREGVLECPWCSARLAPGTDARAAQLGQLQGIASNELSTAESARQASIPDGLHQPDSGDDMPSGFEESGGGIVGVYQGMPMWCMTDVVDGQEITRLELSASTGCCFRALFVWRDSEGEIRRAARAWHQPLPDLHRTTWLDQWEVYSDTDEPLRHRNLLVLPLYDLEPGDALLIDGAGISVWRTAISTTDSMIEHREPLAQLVAELRRALGSD